MSDLKKLESIVKEIETELDEKEEIREQSIKLSRSITRLSGSAIRMMQQSEEARRLLDSAKREAVKLTRMLGNHAEISYAGYVENALQELSEACIVSAVLRGEPMPMPRSIGATSTAYLLGMGDAVGEFRRFALLALTKGDVKRADHYLRVMEDLFAALMRFDYPHAIVAIRRKQDVARSLIEKTRGEILVSSRGKELERKIERLERKLG